MVSIGRFVVYIMFVANCFANHYDHVHSGWYRSERLHE
jgi:hypothetical protein